MSSSESAFIKKLSAFMILSPDEKAQIEMLQTVQRRIKARKELVYENQSGHAAFILQEGWACSYKIMPDGGRQVIDFQVPGDFLGLRTVLMSRSNHAFATVTEVVVAEVPLRKVSEIFRVSPRLAAAVLWATSRDSAMLIEHLADLGRRNAQVRTAHFLLELWDRLRLIGLATEEGYKCPLNQYLIADSLGLSAIHLNRVLRQLREAELLTFRDGQVVFHDLDGLIELAEYDGGYLDHGEAHGYKSFLKWDLQ